MINNISMDESYMHSNSLHQSVEEGYYPQPRITPQAFQMKQFNNNSSEYDHSYYQIQQGSIPPMSTNFASGISGSIPPHPVMMMTPGSYAQGYVQSLHLIQYHRINICIYHSTSHFIFYHQYFLIQYFNDTCRYTRNQPPQMMGASMSIANQGFKYPIRSSHSPLFLSLFFLI